MGSREQRGGGRTWVRASGMGGWVKEVGESGTGDVERKEGVLAQHIRPCSNSASTFQETTTPTASEVGRPTRVRMLWKELVTHVVPFSSSVPWSV